MLLAATSARWTRSVRGAMWAAVVGSNLPDADLVVPPLLSDARLGYLVHHRGHTHTLVAVPLLAVLPFLLARWRAPEARPLPLAALSLVAVALHLGADGWNDYGIHPGWPWDPPWRYGDVLFIVEPWVWVALLPLAWTVASGAWRWVVGAVGIGLVGLAVATLGPWFAAAFVVGLRLGVAAQRARPGPVPAMAALAVVLAAFTAGSRAVEGTILDAVADRPGDVLEVVRSPRPGAPWCWEVLVPSLDDDVYTVRVGRVSLLPGLVDPDACALRSDDRSAPASPPDLPPRPDVHWRASFVGSAAELRALAADQCRMDAFLHFARVPWWVAEPAVFRAGDLRYDREPEPGFAEFVSARGDQRGCEGLPSWRSGTVEALLAAP